MIICYAGLPGAGKSYSAVENVIIPALKAGRQVAHNLELVPEGLAENIGHDVSHLLHQFDKDDTPETLIETCPLGAVIVIDEIWRYWPAGTKVNQVPKEHVRFFKEHRHRVGDDGIASEIVVVDQDPQTGFPAFIRALVDETYLHQKLDKVGMKDRFRVDVYSRSQSAEKPSSRAKLREMYGRYKPEVYRCYKSHTQSARPDEAGLELAADGRANILKSGTVKAAIVAMLVMPFMMWFAVNRFFAIAPGKPKAENTQGVFRDQAGQQLAQPNPQQPPYSVPAMTPEPTPTPEPTKEEILQATIEKNTIPLPDEVAKLPQLSKKWRLVGVIRKPGGEGIARLAAIGGFRQIPAKYCVSDQVGDIRCAVEDGFATFYSAVDTGKPLSAKRVKGADQANVPIKSGKKTL